MINSDKLITCGLWTQLRGTLVTTLEMRWRYIRTRDVDWFSSILISNFKYVY